MAQRGNRRAAEKQMVNAWHSSLTTREWVIANALARGMSYNEIAEEFHISFHTVASHVKSILRKTGQTSSRRVAAMIRLADDSDDFEQAG